MSRLLYEQRAFKRFKDLLKFARTFVFKDVATANLYESAKSIVYGNGYIAACTDGLPYIEKYGKKGFTGDLYEYNLMPDGVTFFKEAFQLNSKYVNQNAGRYRTVTTAAYNTNRSSVDPLYKGNVFELNSYYRGLYCDYNVDPKDSRLAGDYEIMYYDTNFMPTDMSIITFMQIYNANRLMFIKTMESKGFTWESNIRTFNKWFMTVASVIGYLDNEMGHIFDVDAMNQFEIRNFLYSFGITYLDELPTDFQLRTIKNIRRLMKYKGTNEVFGIIVKDIFGGDSVNIYKYYLIRENDLDTQDIKNIETQTGTMDLAKIFSKESNTLKFVKIPYDEANIDEYIATHNLKRYDFDDIISGDAYWKTANASEILSYVNNKLQTKYIEVNTNVRISDETIGIELFFAMLHDMKKEHIGLYYNSVTDESITMFDAMVSAFYILFIMHGYNASSVSTNMLWSDISNPAVSGVLLAICNESTDIKVNNAITKFIEEYSVNSEADRTNDVVFRNKKDVSTAIGESGQEFFNAFKNNFELLKELKDLLRFTYNEDDTLGYGIDPSKSGDGAYKNDYKYPLEGKASGDSEFVKSVYAEMHEEYLSDGYATIDYLPGMKGAVDFSLLISNILERYEATTGYTTENYGTYKDVASYLAVSCPKLYKNITIAKNSGNTALQELFNKVTSDISLTLAQYTVKNPFTKVSNTLSEDVLMKGYGKYFMLKYAKELIERFKSYTVQVHTAASAVEYDEPCFNSLIMHDNLDPSSSRIISLSEYLWTGKNASGVSPVTDSLRTPDVTYYENSTIDNENLIDGIPAGHGDFKDSESIGLSEYGAVYVNTTPETSVIPAALENSFKALFPGRQAAVLGGRIIVNGDVSSVTVDSAGKKAEYLRTGETIPVRSIDLYKAEPDKKYAVVATETSTADNIVAADNETATSVFIKE